MAVTATKVCRIIPINRVPGRPQFNPSIIARWLSTNLLSCDASGGTAELMFVLGGVGEVYGSNMLWDLRAIGANSAAGVLSTTPMTITVSSWEIDGGYAMQYTWQPQWTMGGTVMRELGMLLPDFKHRGSDIAGAPSEVKFSFPNTVGQAWACACGGYIYDERMI